MNDMPLHGYREYSPGLMRERATRFRVELQQRRTVRDFSRRPVERAVIEQCLLAAGSAPSGANQQPWHFAVVAEPATKARIRVAAEAEEREFYARRAPQDWLDALAPLGTDASKPFLETAPYLIAIFAQAYGHNADGSQRKHYYVSESVGIATGLLIAALHHAGLATLTHTPSPMGFLSEILGRPKNEKPYLLLVTGYPVENARVPVIEKKGLMEFTSWE
ncbi:MAG: nitroreductase family protein [Dehalococcoidia bacterium]